MAMDERQELRAGDRTNLYLAANLHWRAGGSAVRIRNLSARGAMIEAQVLPAAGTAVELVRGALRACGSAMWTSGNRAGVRLDEPVAVREWMSTASGSAQQGVDGVVRALRAGEAPPFQPRQSADLTATPADDLGLACRLLDQLGNVLVSDMDVVARHGRELQSLDVVQQLLQALARAGIEPHRQGARLLDLRAAARAALAD